MFAKNTPYMGWARGPALRIWARTLAPKRCSLLTRYVFLCTFWHILLYSYSIVLLG